MQEAQSRAVVTGMAALERLVRANRSDLAPYGAGETSHKPVIAAIANAIHDATGVRLHRPPFRKERVLAALRAANV